MNWTAEFNRHVRDELRRNPLNPVFEYKRLSAGDEQTLDREIMAYEATGWELHSQVTDIKGNRLAMMKRLISVEHCYETKKITSFCQEELANDIADLAEEGWEVVEQKCLSAELKREQPDHMILRARTQESLKNLENRYVADGWILKVTGPMVSATSGEYFVRFIHKPDLDPDAIDAALAQIGPCKKYVPVTYEDMSTGIKQLVEAKHKQHYTTHEACVEIAMLIKQPYEWVRERYDSTLVSEMYRKALRNAQSS